MDVTHFINFLQKNYIQQANSISLDSLLAQTCHDKLIKLLVQKNVLETVAKELPVLLKLYLKEMEKDLIHQSPFRL